MGMIKPIRTEADYEAALARIAALMDAEPGTPEGEELDVLTDLVEHHEAKHVPMGYPSAVAAIEAGFYQQQIQESAYRYQRQVESGERVIVGVNRFTETSQQEVEILRIGAELEAAQVERVARVRATRSAPQVSRALDALRHGAEGTDNLVPLMRDALDHHATVGEVCGALRDVFGVYHPQVAV